MMDATISPTNMMDSTVHSPRSEYTSTHTVETTKSYIRKVFLDRLSSSVKGTYDSMMTYTDANIFSSPIHNVELESDVKYKLSVETESNNTGSTKFSNDFENGSTSDMTSSKMKEKTISFDTSVLDVKGSYKADISTLSEFHSVSTSYEYRNGGVLTNSDKETSVFNVLSQAEASTKAVTITADFQTSKLNMKGSDKGDISTHSDFESVVTVRDGFRTSVSNVKGSDEVDTSTNYEYTRVWTTSEQSLGFNALSRNEASTKSDKISHNEASTKTDTNTDIFQTNFMTFIVSSSEANPKRVHEDAQITSSKV